MLAEMGSGQWFLFIFEVFMFVIWFWLLITIFSDLFRDHEISGWAKAAWIIFVIILPFLGILVYLIVRGHGMGERAIAEAQRQHDQFDAYVKATAGASAGGGSAADQISQAKALLDAGTISQAEFDQLKAKALS